jgi:hypothetical protein
LIINYRGFFTPILTATVPTAGGGAGRGGSYQAEHYFFIKLLQKIN